MTKVREWPKKTRAIVAVVLAMCMMLGLISGIHVLAEDDKTVTLTYDLNGGAIKERYFQEYFEPVTAEVGEYINLPSSYHSRDGLGSPDEDNLFFAGWAYDAAGKKKIKSDQITIDQDTTIYARWQKQVVVTFEANGGYFGEDNNTYSQEDVNVYSKDGYVFRAPTNPRQSGKAFTDWYLTPECAEDSLVSAPEYYDFEEDTTLYAGWTDGYAVTFDFNGGRSQQQRKKEVQSYPTGTAVDYPTNYYAPSDSRKGIAGWYKDPSFSEESKVENGTVYNEDVTLYAKWVEKFTVTIKGAPRRNSETSFDRGEVIVQVLPGETVNYSSYCYGSNKNNVLAGFYTERNGKGDLAETTIRYYWEDSDGYGYAITYLPIADTTLYAYWTKPISLTLNANGGYFDKYNSETDIYEKYQEYTQIRAPYVKWQINNNRPYNDNYRKLEGWATTPDATTGLPIDEYVANKSETLYAIWSEERGVTSTSKYDVTTHENEPSKAPDDDKPTTTTSTTNRAEPSTTDRATTKSGDNDIVEPSSTTTTTSRQGGNSSSNSGSSSGSDSSAATTKSESTATTAKDEGTTKYEPTKKADDGSAAEKANGVVKLNGKWVYAKDGEVDTSYTGIAKNQYGWWRIENGYVNFDATGIYKNEYGWWRVENGKVNFKANGIYKNQYGWWKTTNGKVTFKENGVFKNEYGWWKVEKSKVNFKFTGIAKNEYGTWYVKNGKVDFSKTGKVLYNGKTYNVVKGKVK